MDEQNQETHLNPSSNRKGYIILLNIFLALIVASQIRVWQAGPYSGYVFMQTFMGFWFLVFGFFKALNWKVFAMAYGDYDLIARRSKIYAYAYPAIELSLGAVFLLNYQPIAVNSTALALMAVSAVGIAKNLLLKNQIPCLCLGAIIKLPLSKISLVEDIVMGIMAFATLMRLT